MLRARFASLSGSYIVRALGGGAFVVPSPVPNDVTDILATFASTSVPYHVAKYMFSVIENTTHTDIVPWFISG